MSDVELEDVRRRALACLRVDYRSWLRYGDRADRASARTMAWVLTGHQYSYWAAA